MRSGRSLGFRTRSISTMPRNSGRTPCAGGAEEYGIELIHRPVATPHYGGHIERLIGTMMGAVHLLPGTTFSDIGERGGYDSAAPCDNDDG